MAKVYTFVQRLLTSDGETVYAHQGPDVAYSKNSKATTAKRNFEDANDLCLTNWSYTLQDSNVVPAPGEKVYVVMRKVVDSSGRRVLLNVNGERGMAYVSKRSATGARKAWGKREDGFVVFSFIIDQPAKQYYPVTIHVLADNAEQAAVLVDDAMGEYYAEDLSDVTDWRFEEAAA